MVQTQLPIQCNWCENLPKPMFKFVFYMGKKKNILDFDTKLQKPL